MSSPPVKHPVIHSTELGVFEFESSESFEDLTLEDYEFVANVILPFALNEMINLSEYPLIANLTNDKLTNNLTTVDNDLFEQDADTLNEQYIKEIFKQVIDKKENRAQAAEEILTSVTLGTIKEPKETQIGNFFQGDILFVRSHFG